MTIRYFFILTGAITGLLVSVSCSSDQKINEKITETSDTDYYPSGKPYTRWWWNARVLDTTDIKEQLHWLDANGFGGVEVAFIYPVDKDPSTERTEWLSSEMANMVEFTKQYADELGMGCDFTYGTLWPFGDTQTPDKYNVKKFGNPDFKQTETRGWVLPDTLFIIDHLDKEAFAYYASRLDPMFENVAGSGKKTAFFCDSWEVDTQHIWSNDFEKDFKELFGYDIVPYMEDIYNEKNKHALYDYMKLVSQKTMEGFYIPFHQKTHELGGFSRVQVAGAPTDLIEAYALVDVPETEAMLYEPNYSKIVASAAALADKKTITSETFTCIYGWPDYHMFEEKIEHLKLVADALFANGVNQIFWHGYNYNPVGSDSISFYATSHVGKKGALSKHLAPFNDYMGKISRLMRKGNTYTDIAVYLPKEDSWMAGFYPDSLQMPWSWGQYEQRYLKYPEELKGYHPLWINGGFMEKARLVENKLALGNNLFNALVIDADFLDIDNLKIIFDKAVKGLPIFIKHQPKQAGMVKDVAFTEMLQQMLSLPNVVDNFKELNIPKPIIEGESIPEFWIKKEMDTYHIFFANPKTKELKYPLDYDMGLALEKYDYPITININGKSITTNLTFSDGESLLLKVDDNGVLSTLDISYFNQP
ncbi:glycosyl hydrolase [Muricauda sp. ANG21]|uniref:glycosyl hydrolase n=1 Tax=Allomuricauda sp. ANG21 TaxID=3042468 RepID=UPI0034567AA4